MSLYNNGYSDYYNHNNHNNHKSSHNSGYNMQDQCQLDLQKQSLKYSYETLGNLLSAAENFAGLKDEQYSAYNYSSSNDYNSLKSEFAWELDCFKMAMNKYQQKYGPYKFPPDCSKEKILKDIQKYISLTPKQEDKMLYLLMADIINGKKVNTDFTNIYKELDENAENKFEPKKMAKIVGPLNQILDQAEKDAQAGNMDLLKREKAAEYSKEQLKKINQEHEIPATPATKKVIIGEKGKLILTRTNQLYFISDMNESKKLISGINHKEIKDKAFFNSKNGIIYISQIINGSANCILFSPNKIQNIKVKDIEIKGQLTTDNFIYSFGTANIKGHLVDILVDKDDVL